MLIDALIPQGAVAVDTRDAGSPERLLAAERASLGRAAPRRLREFAAGRCCARAALARLGRDPEPILRGPERDPRWPQGIVGSITHCPGYCAAAVAGSAALAAIGIDAEVDDELPAGVLERIARDDERRWIDERRGDAIHWDRTLFCAKEAVYKVWFPLARQSLGFRDAQVAFDPAAGAFTATLLRRAPGVPRRLHGRYRAVEGLVLVAIALPA